MTRPGGTPPEALSASMAWSDWLDSNDPLLLCDKAEPELMKDSTERLDIEEQMDPADANEAMLPIDAQDATLPTESTESWEPIERIEFSDQRDHTPHQRTQRQPSSGATWRTTLSSTCAL